MAASNDMFCEPIQCYSKEDFVASVPSQTNCLGYKGLDSTLWSAWHKAEESGALNYKTNNVVTKILPGKFNIVVQLNPSRAQKRRKPHPFSKVVEPFDPSTFNFTKIKEEELLFNIRIQIGQSFSQGSVIVNSAPISDCHCLLLPSPSDCCPQVITEQGLLLALSFALLSSSRGLRIGFNSLCAYASVNHYHFHSYYLQQKLYVETAPCSILAGPVHTFNDHFAPGFVFEVTPSSLLQQTREIMKLVQFFQSHEIPHNVFITRGCRLSENFSPQYDTLRVCVWARETTLGAKEVTVFAPALCELAGHVPIYSEDAWGSLEEESITAEINRVCKATFAFLRLRVKLLYQ